MVSCPGQNGKLIISTDILPIIAFIILVLPPQKKTPYAYNTPTKTLAGVLSVTSQCNASQTCAISPRYMEHKCQALNASMT